jgi:YfiH family protein
MSRFWIEPDWPVPPGIRAASTLRRGGVSMGSYLSLNLGAHVGDEPGRVAENRRRLMDALNLPAEPVWLNQVHGNRVVRADAPASDQSADAAVTHQTGVVCAVMTADCLPVLLCSKEGDRVAAVHAGWKGLAAGIIEAAVEALEGDDFLAWLGPAIGPEAFEVGHEVREIFVRKRASFAAAFRETENAKWLADLYHLARIILNDAGISAIYGGGFCTFSNVEDFFSYRRDQVTGRMATLIWRE